MWGSLGGLAFWSPYALTFGEAQINGLAFRKAALIVFLVAAAAKLVGTTPLGSTLVVTEMAGLQLIPMTLIAAVVSLFLTSEVGLIHTQRRREGEFDEATTGGDALSETGDGQHAPAERLSTS